MIYTLPSLWYGPEAFGYDPQDEYYPSCSRCHYDIDECWCDVEDWSDQ